MVKLASVVVAGLAFCVLANDSDKVGREISRKSVGNVGNGWFGRVLNRRAYDKSQGLGGDGEKFNDKAVSHLRGGKKKSPAPMSRAKIFRIKMLNFLHTLSNSALESVPHITKLLASPVGRDLSICFSNKDPSELASKIGLWVLKTIPMSAALAPFENIRVARDQAGGDVFLGVKQMWQRDGVLGFWRNLWLLAAQNFAIFWIMAATDMGIRSLLKADGVTRTENEKTAILYTAAMLATIASSFAVSPIQLAIKRRNAEMKPAYQEIACGAVNGAQTLYGIASKEGKSALFKGAGKRAEDGMKAVTWAYMMPLIAKAYKKHSKQ